MGLPGGRGRGKTGQDFPCTLGGSLGFPTHDGEEEKGGSNPNVNKNNNEYWLMYIAFVWCQAV